MVMPTAGLQVTKAEVDKAATQAVVRKEEKAARAGKVELAKAAQAWVVKGWEAAA
jgi:hypothetical protein